MEFSIVGGGLLGRLIAWQLAQQGAQVHLYDKADKEGTAAAAYVAAAMLAPLAEAIESTPLVTDLAWQSLSLWSKWIPQFSSPVFHQQAGSLIVWHQQDKPLAIDFQHHLERCHGVSSDDWGVIDGSVVGELEPQLSGRFRQGLLLKTEGQLDNRQVLLALAEMLEEADVHCHWQQEISEQDFENLAGVVIDCRGVGAKQAWHHIMDGSRLRGIRGEVARVYAPEVVLNRPVRLLHPRYPLYIAPKENHIFVIGATQLESEDDGPVAVRSGLELLSALYAVHPAFGEARILELASGLRPTLSHHDPEIRYLKDSHVIEVNGLFRHGFMIAPAVSQAAVHLAIMVAKKMVLPMQDDVSGMPYQVIEGE